MVKDFRGGYAGKVLRVDLSNAKVTQHKLDKALARNYIGGRGLNSRVLYDEVGPTVDPLGPENLLIFGVGPLNGTASPASGRWTVTAKSPLTGILGDANAGGGFGAELKYAGFDQVIISGKARDPVYLWIDDGRVEIKSAGHLWSKTTWETEDIVKRDLGDMEIKVASVGPAGEKLVRFACIITDLARAAGRTGMGTVMASKNLKAVAIRGSKDVEIAVVEKFEKAVQESCEKIMSDPVYEELSVYGTSRLLSILNNLGQLMTRNAQTQFFEAANDIDMHAFLKYAVKSKSCFGCVIHCAHWIEVRDGPYNGTRGEALEYMSLEKLGASCGNSDLPSIIKAHILCNQLGLDVGTTAAVIAFAMECYEKGILQMAETDGLDLSWGNHRAMIDLIERIACRKGLGNLLAEGVKKASENIGKGSAEFALQIKGLECLSFEKMGYALGYATSTRGADHLRSLYNIFPGQHENVAIDIWGTTDYLRGKGTEGQAMLVKWHQDLLAAVDSLETCKFNCVMCYGMGPRELATLYSSATGWPMSGEELLKTGERIYNVERMFNVREGMSRKDDTLPKRIYDVVPSGPTKGTCFLTQEDLNKILDEYYVLRGWDKNGIPTEEKIEELKLQEREHIHVHLQNTLQHPQKL